MPDDNPLHPERLALDLYAAVLDGAPVQGVLDAIRRGVGADSAWISRVAFAGNQCAGAERFEQIGLDPASTADYLAHWVKHDPWLIASAGLGPGVHNYDHAVPQRDYLASAFWNDFASRQQPAAQHVVAAGVAVAGEATGMLALQRNGRAGAFGAREEKLLAAIYPHLSRALLIEARLAEAGLQAAGAGAGLDALRHGVAIIAPNGRLVRVNTALHDMVARRDGLRLSPNRPLADDPAAQARLSRAIDAALAAAPRAAAPATDIFAVPRPSGGAWRVQVTALQAGATGPFAGFTGALVMVADPRQAPLPSATTVQAMLGLTPAEASLVLALAAGHSLAQHARRRRVALETLRTHLASIRRKTGCRRQAELVALIVALGA